MTDESERAAYYETHKDDPQEWGDAVPQTGPRRRLASMFSVRLAPGEATAVRRAAESRGMSVSAFLRNAALAAAETGHASRMPDVPMTSSSAALAITFVVGPEGADVAVIGGTTSPQFSSTWDAVYS